MLNVMSFIFTANTRQSANTARKLPLSKHMCGGCGALEGSKEDNKKKKGVWLKCTSKDCEFRAHCRCVGVYLTQAILDMPGCQFRCPKHRPQPMRDMSVYDI